MSSVRARQDGRLFLDFRFRGERCRELTTLQDSPANRRKVERVLAVIDAQIADGTFLYGRTFPGSRKAAQFAGPRSLADAPAIQACEPMAEQQPTPLFGEFVRLWVSEKQIEWRLGYRTSMTSILDTHLLPRFGDLDLASITRADVLGFRSELVASRGRRHHKKGEGEPLAAATINRIVGVLGMIMAEAALRFDVANPCVGIKRLKLQRQDVQPFTLEEVRRILARVRADYRPYLMFRFFTGVRSAEAHGLKWKFVDFANRQVLIRETYTHGRTEYTKTDGSQREIVMSQPVYDALQAMRPEGFAEDPLRFDDVYVFRTRADHPIDNSNFVDRVWKPLLRNLELPYRRPYDMRHTCATLWLAAGEAPEWIARQLGHTTTEMLFRTYSRYVPNLIRHDGNAFDRLVTGALLGGTTGAATENMK